MRTKLKGRISLLFMAFALILAIPAMALASELNGSVVDTTAPEGSVTLSPGNSGNITINMSVTGNQEGTATFKVYKNWTLSGGSFTGSNAQQFEVKPRKGGDPATTFSVPGTVSVASTQAAGGPFTLKVGAFDITNSNTEGAKLSAREFSTYQITVQSTSDPCASVTDPAAPVISSNPANPDGLSGWFKTIPTVSASSSTSGATITYATEVDGGAKSSYSSTAPTLGQGETILYAKATSATCDKVSESSKTFLVDSIAPAISGDDINNTTWRNTNLSANFTASDNANGSGLANSADASFTLTASAESTKNASGFVPTTDSKTVSDFAGNSATRSLSALIDKTAPSITDLGPDALVSQPNAAGWYKDAVSNKFSASDGLSGLANTNQANFSRSSDTDQGSAVQINSGSVSDVAGNTNSGIDSAAFKIDRTAPTLSPTVSPNPVLLNGTATASANAADQVNLSGLASQSCDPVNTSSVGSKSVNCSATDIAGNSANASASYSVIYNWTGFFRPVDNPSVVNVAKAGSAIPMKFSLSGNQGLNILNPNPPKVTQMACSSSATLDTVEETVAASNSGLTYDASIDQYNYVWKTQSTFATKCYKIDIKLDDGTSHEAHFKFTK